MALPKSYSPGLLPPVTSTTQTHSPLDQAERSPWLQGHFCCWEAGREKCDVSVEGEYPGPGLGYGEMPGLGPEGGEGPGPYAHPPSAPRRSLFFFSRRQVPPAPPLSLMSSQTLMSCCWNHCPHLRTSRLLVPLVPSSSSSSSSSYLPPHYAHWRKGGKQGLGPAWMTPSCLTEEQGKP